MPASLIETGYVFDAHLKEELLNSTSKEGDFDEDTEQKETNSQNSPSSTEEELKKESQNDDKDPADVLKKYKCACGKVHHLFLFSSLTLQSGMQR